MSDKPRFLRRRTRPLTPADVARIRKDALSRRDALLAVDRGVASVVSALRAHRQLSNTYIVFTSDNGYMQGEHRVRSGKMLPYDPSTRVPLLIRGPRIPEGSASRELVANVDLAPTVVQIAQALPGVTVDGRSLLPFARRPGRRSRRAILHETGGRRYVGLRAQDEAPNRGRSLGRVLTYRAVRTPRWLYVRYRGGSRELYDLRRDPHQLAPGMPTAPTAPCGARWRESSGASRTAAARSAAGPRPASRCPARPSPRACARGRAPCATSMREPHSTRRPGRAPRRGWRSAPG